MRGHLRERMERLRRTPRMGVKTSELGIRILPPTRYPCRINYTIVPEAVVILHLRHSARRHPDFNNLAD